MNHIFTFFFSFRILTLILSSGRAFAIDLLQGIFASLKPCSGSSSSPLSQRLQVREKRKKKRRNNQTYKLDLDRLLLFFSFCTASLQAWPCWVPPASPIATRRCATTSLDLIFFFLSPLQETTNRPWNWWDKFVVSNVTPEVFYPPDPVSKLMDGVSAVLESLFALMPYGHRRCQL